MAITVKNVTFPIEGKGAGLICFGQCLLILINVMHSNHLRCNFISGPQLDKNRAVFLRKGGGGGEGKSCMKEIYF